MRKHLLHGVGQENGTVSHRAAHLPSAALQGREELAVDERWLVQTHAGSHVSGHAEVRVLQ